MMIGHFALAIRRNVIFMATSIYLPSWPYIVEMGFFKPNILPS